MTTIPLYQVDAFASELFAGNPAAVCPLATWLPSETMQRIATENNLSETAFFVQEGGELRIRWFTPTVEVRLCGHATLASAYVYFQRFDTDADEVTFESASGTLPVRREGNLLVLDFPAANAEPVEVPTALRDALGIEPLELHRSDDWLVVLPDEASVRTLEPNLQALAQLDARGVIVTARGDECDFVSRFFAPRCGIDEDPATGSAHTLLTPFWAKRLDKRRLFARQLSRRGAELYCEHRGDRALLGGHVVPYLEGTITIPTP